MRTITIQGGAASIEGHKVVLMGTQENSDEVVRIELDVEILNAMQEATKKEKKKGGDH